VRARYVPEPRGRAPSPRRARRDRDDGRLEARNAETEAALATLEQALKDFDRTGTALVGGGDPPHARRHPPQEKSGGREQVVGAEGDDLVGDREHRARVGGTILFHGVFQLGRISHDKRLDRAIAIANALGLPLRIAAKVDKVDEAYFREVITPLLGRPGVEFVGEINDCDKARFLGEALALLFPIDWPEPFGLVMIEAMACGTPVLGFRCGSVPEIIDDRLTGRIVATVDEAIRAAPEVIRLDRRPVRRRFEERFSSRRMANDYLEVYRSMGRGAKLVPHAASALGRNIFSLHRKRGVEHHAS
jgi:hypothetical protein